MVKLGVVCATRSWKKHPNHKSRGFFIVDLFVFCKKITTKECNVSSKVLTFQKTAMPFVVKDRL
jgi:hypothetical protein